MLGFLHDLMDALTDQRASDVLGAAATGLRVSILHNQGTAERAVAKLQSGRPEAGGQMRMVECTAKLAGNVLGITVAANVTINDSTVLIDASYDKPWYVPQALIENRVNAALAAALS